MWCNAQVLHGASGKHGPIRTVDLVGHLVDQLCQKSQWISSAHPFLKTNLAIHIQHMLKQQLTPQK
ncbi:hypothetical protein PJP10_32875, partial [Mycobacterium kansasii]